MAVTLRQLEIFEKVALTEHVTKASDKLFISQSAVSMAIAELEKETGGLLFERRGRRLLLNERGRLFLPKVKEILRQLANLVSIMQESADNPIGILNVGASTTIGNYLLPRLVGEFSAQYPRAEVLLHIGNTQQIEAGVQSGELDLGLIEGPSHLADLECIPWREDELVVIAGPEHIWAEKAAANNKMLAAVFWIMREEGSGTREVFETAMAPKVGKFNIGLELGHTEAIKKAVEAGLGVSCLSRLAVQRELENKWLVEVKTPLKLKRNLSILRQKNRYKTKLFNSFIELLQENKK